MGLSVPSELTKKYWLSWECFITFCENLAKTEEQALEIDALIFLLYVVGLSSALIEILEWMISSVGILECAILVPAICEELTINESELSSFSFLWSFSFQEHEAASALVDMFFLGFALFENVP